MTPYDRDLAEDDMADLRAEARWERQREARLARNPDCRDPDHPGCEACGEDESDDD